MTYLDRIEECNRHDLSRYVPMVTECRQRVGWVRSDRLELLGDVLGTSPSQVLLPGGTRESRTARLAEVVRQLADAGVMQIHGEQYPIAAALRAEHVAVVDRSAVSWFGVSAAGVHLNGFVRRGEELFMWVAFRSREKPTFPGMLDNMVAGGQPVGLGLRENVVKECGEEAGIDVELAQRAKAVGAVSYVAEHEKGLKPDTMFCFDLELPEGFEPTPVDGEVEKFELWPIDRVAETVRDTTRFKFNCNLVVIDFLLRHGVIDADDPDYIALSNGLRRAL